MPEDKDSVAHDADPLALWTFEGNRDLQIRMGLEMTPSERLRWLEETVEELLPWTGRARLGRPVKSSS